MLFFNLYWNCNEKRTKISKKEAGIGPFFKKQDLSCHSKLKRQPWAQSYIQKFRENLLFLKRISCLLSLFLFKWSFTMEFLLKFKPLRIRWLKQISEKNNQLSCSEINTLDWIIKVLTRARYFRVGRVAKKLTRLPPWWLLWGCQWSWALSPSCEQKVFIIQSFNCNRKYLSPFIAVVRQCRVVTLLRNLLITSTRVCNLFHL